MRPVKVLWLCAFLSATGCVAPAVRDVIRFDCSGISAEGLAGPAGGQVAVDYEFCIPDLPKARDEVRAVDSTVRFLDGSRGRIGCGPGQVLCIGSTHQPGWRDVLLNLARLPYVARIERCFWE